MMGFDLAELFARLKLGDDIKDYAIADFEGEVLFYLKSYENHKKSLDLFKARVIDLGKIDNLHFHL